MTKPLSHAAVRRAFRAVGDRLEVERRQRIARRDGTPFYRPEDLGPYCAAGCGTRLVRPLADAGIAVHPSCGPVV